MTIRARHGFLIDTRAVIALRGRDELGLWAAEIARQVGLNTSGFAKAIERAEQHYGYMAINITNRNNVPKGSKSTEAIFYNQSEQKQPVLFL